MNMDLKRRTIPGVDGYSRIVTFNPLQEWNTTWLKNWES